MPFTPAEEEALCQLKEMNGETPYSLGVNIVLLSFTTALIWTLASPKAATSDDSCARLKRKTSQP